MLWLHSLALLYLEFWHDSNRLVLDVDEMLNCFPLMSKEYMSSEKIKPCNLTLSVRAATIHRYIGEPQYFFLRYEYRHLNKIARYYGTIKYATSTNLGNHRL